MYDGFAGMPKGGRLPLDFFVIGESTPVCGGIGWWCWRLCIIYFLRREGFRRMSLAATGEQSRSLNTSSP